MAFFANDFLNIDPVPAGASGGGPGSALGFEVGILVFSDGGGPGPTIATEYFCVRTTPTRVTPESAEVPGDNNLIVITADLPLITDGDWSVSFSDTNPSAINGNAFRVQALGQGPSMSLGNFLAGLDSPRVMVGAFVSGDRSNAIEILLDGPLTPSDALTVRRSTIGFASEASGGSVYSFAGEDPNPSLDTFVSMGGPPCPITGNADTNFDDVIDFADLNAVLSSFGQAGAQPGDVDSDGVVNFDDLNAVLSAFGLSCE